jgi:hypothetical protein
MARGQNVCVEIVWFLPKRSKQSGEVKQQDEKEAEMVVDGG